MKHLLLFLGKTKESYLSRGIEDYGKRLQHYCDLTISYLKERGKAREGDKLEQGRLLLAAVPQGALRVVLDGSGKQYDSPGLADLISTWELRGVKQVCYLIGGAPGHSEEVINDADVLISLSKMTFTHDMARLLLLEQLYRAYTIKNGEKYHK